MPFGSRPRPPARSVRVVCAGSQDTSRWANVFWCHAGGSSSPTSSELNSFAEDFAGAYGGNVIAVMHETTVLETVEVSFYGSGEELIQGNSTIGLTGGVSGTTTPAQVAICISWQITVGYRGGKPRTYVPGVPYSWLFNAQSIGPTQANTLADAAEIFRTDVNALTTASMTEIDLGTLSFQRGGAWRTPPVFLGYTGAHVDTRLDTQRRRLGPDVS